MAKKAITAATAENGTPSGTKQSDTGQFGTPPSDATPGNRFGMPHALVIIAFIVTAAFLAPDGMSVEQVLLLLGGAGGIGAAVVALATSGGRGGRIARLLRAYLHAGN
ncbi:hypothetical protein ACFTXB_01445 [Streptomyces sp. NPDC057074]|uniref:hypothetical protein n=1 Tax=Streptomyces sp. NPDC057074 TaxID=3346015 RepID=UPI00363E5765